jgi:hypothetical protein
MDEIRIYYVYKLVRPDYPDPFYVWLLQPFYVGKGKNKQVYRHRKDAKKTFKRQNSKLRMVYVIIHKLWNINLDFIEEVLYDNLTEAEAFTIEKEMIAKYGRVDLDTGCLANHTDGGEGASNPSETARKKMSEIHSGKNNYFWGKSLSEEHKRKLSEAHTGNHHTEEYKQMMSERMSGENNPMYGISPSEEVREMISKIHKGKTISEEAKGRIGDYQRGRPKSEEQKRKMSESRKGKCCGKDHPNYGKSWSEEQRQEFSAKMKGRISPMKGKSFSAEHKKKLSDTNKRRSKELQYIKDLVENTIQRCFDY